MKFLKYRSKNTGLNGNIQVDISRYKEIKELEHLIMSDCHLDEDQYFIVFDQHQEKLIEKIKFDSEIKISVYRYYYLYFQFPNVKSPIKLNSPFENTFQDTIVSFKKNNIYLSFDFIKNMKMLCNGKELKKDGKPFHGLKDNDHVKIECITETVNLYYGYKKFIFCENELASVPKNFIGSQYKGCETVKIKDKNNKKILGDNDRLKSNAQYEVKIPYKITFRNKLNGIPTTKMLDFLATAKDAQKKIAKVYSTQNLIINPEDVILSNADQQITRYSATSPLISQNPRHEFYFEIKVGAKKSILNPIPQNNKKDHQHQHDQKHQDNYIHNSGNKLDPDDQNYPCILFNKEPSHGYDKLKKAHDDRRTEPIKKSKNKKVKKQQSDDDDDESSEDKKRPQKAKPKNQKARPSKSSDDDDDDEDEEFQPLRKSKPKNQKQKRNESSSENDTADDDESSEDKKRPQKAKPKNKKARPIESSDDDDENSEDKKRPQTCKHKKRFLKPKIIKINDDDHNEKSKDKKGPQTSSPKNQNKKSKSEKSSKDDDNSENDHKRLQSGRPKIQNNDDDNDEDDSKFDSPRK